MCVFPLPQEYPQWSKLVSGPPEPPAPKRRGYGPAVIVTLSEKAQEHLRSERLRGKR
jgi:hypothetical protein